MRKKLIKEKICRECKRKYSLEFFYKSITMKDGHINSCVGCRRKYSRNYFKKMSDEQREKHRSSARKFYREVGRERYKKRRTEISVMKKEIEKIDLKFEERKLNLSKGK